MRATSGERETSFREFREKEKTVLHSQLLEEKEKRLMMQESLFKTREE